VQVVEDIHHRQAVAFDLRAATEIDDANGWGFHGIGFLCWGELARVILPPRRENAPISSHYVGCSKVGLPDSARTALRRLSNRIVTNEQASTNTVAATAAPTRTLRDPQRRDNQPCGLGSRTSNQSG